MTKVSFMAFANFAFIFSLSVAAAVPLASDDAIDPFLEHVRWDRGADYGTGIGGPVAAGPTGPPPGSDGDGNSTIDECPSGDSSSQVELVKDPSDSQCGFAKRSSQVLAFVKNGDGSATRNQKLLKTAVCNEESDCIRQCLANQCTYFIQNVRDKRLGLTFFYLLDEKTLDDNQYSPSNFFNSYARQCQSGSSQVRHASKRSAPLPRKNPPGSPPLYARQRHTSHEVQATNSGSKQRDMLPGGGPATDVFKKYAQTFGKKYTGQESSLRASIFESNVKRIAQLNSDVLKSAGKDGAVYGWTPFADFTHDEFLKSFTGAMPDLDAEKVSFTDQDLANNVKNRPSVVDWQQQGALGRVRNQGACGSCYAFSSADLISAQNAIETKQSPKTLSAQYIADCISDNGGCTGARVGKVMMKAANDNKGVPLEQCYRYQEKNGTCKKDSSCCLYQKVKWSQTLDITGPKEKDIMAALLQWGPVISVIEASEAWQFHNGTGIIKASQCSKGKGQQNHAVLLTGYNFQGPTPYYIVRNSWSQEWGDRGYGKLEAGTNACSVARTVVTACARDCDQAKNAKSRLGQSPPFKKTGS